MELTKEIAVDQITVTNDGIILVREATTIKENGIEIGKRYHRTSFVPGDNVSAQPNNVKAICSAVWTPEVIEAYKAQQETNQLGD